MLYTNRLILERPTLEDYSIFYALHTDPKASVHHPHGPMDAYLAQASFETMLMHWEEFHFGVWKMILPEADNAVMGFGGLSYRLYKDLVRVNLGYRIAYTYWDRGYATELAQAALSYGFDEMKFLYIHALVRPSNKASIRILEKCMMKQIGTLDDVPGEESSLIFAIDRLRYALLHRDGLYY